MPFAWSALRKAEAGLSRKAQSNFLDSITFSASSDSA
jgi:hypothetical protein